MRTTIRGMLGILALALAACSEDPAGVPPLVVAVVEVTPVAKTLSVGDTLRMVARPKTSSGDVLGGLPAQWTTSDDVVAGVSPLGVVTAKSPGTARITATISGKAGSTEVTVVAAPLVVDKIEIHALPAELEAGQQVRIEAILKAADGTVIGGRSVTWRSSNGPAATVDGLADSPFALVTAHAVGGATITAEAEGRTASVLVWVRAAPPEVGFVIPSPGSRTLWVGEVITFTAAVLGKTGGPLPNTPAVTWSVEDPTVAVVDASGRVLAKKAGSTIVKAMSGGVSGSATVHVLPQPGETLALELNANVDPDGNIRTPIVIGTTTWYEDGVLYPARYVVAGASFELRRSWPLDTWEQTFRVETRVLYPSTGITRVVASHSIVDRGTYMYTGTTNDGGMIRYTFTSSASSGLQFTGEQTEAGRLVLRQTIGSAPAGKYLYEIQ